MDIIEATEAFEKWLEQQVPLVRQDLKLKHASMAEAAFPFFRATFYRWLQLWQDVCKDIADAPKVLGVGDLHIENFGTWRDVEGRLIWGVNDLDEAWPAAYTLDLVRVTASAYLAIWEQHLSLTRREAAEAIEARLSRRLGCRRQSLCPRRRSSMVTPDGPQQITRSRQVLGQTQSLAKVSRQGSEECTETPSRRISHFRDGFRSKTPHRRTRQFRPSAHSRHGHLARRPYRPRSQGHSTFRVGLD